MPLGTKIGLGPGDIVLDVYPVPPRKGTAAPPPTFRLTLFWHGRPSQQLLSSCICTVGFWATVCKRFPLSCWTIVSLSFLSVTLVYCGQMVGWIRMPLDVEVGLGPCHIF